MNLYQEAIQNKFPMPPQILVMEDEFNVAKGLQMVLTEEGYAVDVAMTGYSALEKFDNKYFDLLVADLRLPDIDGMEVIKRVKSNRPDTEVVVITGYSNVPSAVNAMKMGVYDYISKPFTQEEIKTAVEGALKDKQELPSTDHETIADEDERLIQKREVLRVLNRTFQDDDFWSELMEKGSQALEKYRLLSAEAKCAVVTGDLNWIKEHVGDLTAEQLHFIYKRLEREVW